MLAVVFSAIWVFSEITFSPGVRMGFHLANVAAQDSAGEAIDTSSKVTKKAKIGYAGRATLKIGINDILSIEPAAGIVTRGFIKDQQISTFNEDVVESTNLSLTYLEVPILARASFETGALHPFLEIGPNFGLVIGAKSKTTGMASENVKKDYESLDIGLDLGIGTDLEMGSLTPFVAGGYHFGLSNIQKISILKESTRNTALALQAGVRYTLE